MSWQDIPGWMAFQKLYDHYVDHVARDGDTVVEIGCLFGRSVGYLAERAIDRGLKIRIFAVDRWVDDTERYLPEGHPFRETLAKYPSPFDAFRGLVREHLRPAAAETIHPVCRPSAEAAAGFEDASLALVMVDGDHAEGPCAADIRAWAPKVRPGGILAGDDYGPEPGFSGVVRAVKSVLGKDYRVDGTTWVATAAGVSRLAGAWVAGPVALRGTGPAEQQVDGYDLGSLPDLDRPTVLDVGAHAGAFAARAAQRWPGTKLACYEPHPETFRALSDNLAPLGAALVEAAVVHPAGGKRKLFEGKDASTDASLRDDLRWPHVSQDYSRSHEVDTFDAAALPECDVLKVDTEGCEVEILSVYPHLGRVRVLLAEAHAVAGDLPGQVRTIREIAARSGLKLVDQRGTVQRFVRESAEFGTRAVSGGIDDWVLVESIGGERWVGCPQGFDGGVAITLCPALIRGPDTMFAPLPVAGQGYDLEVIGIAPTCWLPMRAPGNHAVTVRWASIEYVKNMPDSAKQALVAIVNAARGAA